MGLLMMVSCTSEDTTASSSSGASAATAVTFKPYIGSGETRATYPADAGGNGIVGAIDNDRLKTTSFGVFAQYTENTAWGSYTKTTPFNFMWNQKVTWDALNSFWTYAPVKYWPNDNQPADLSGATGSQPHSYLSFFAYAPYQAETTPATGFNEMEAANDGIVFVSPNNEEVEDAHLYYRTSNEKPFGVDESVDLLWASQQNLWKTKESGEGYVDGQVHLTFRHALSKLDITVRAMIDRTEDLTHDGYSTSLDANTKVFMEEAVITTPTIHPEGKLMIGKGSETTPSWDYTGVTGQDGFTFDSNTENDVFDVSYSLRYAGSNVPADASFTDGNSDGIDDVTGLTEAETVKAVFDDMTTGVTDAEQQLAADYATLMFPPSAEPGTLSVRTKYHVVTYDPQLTLNNPKFYSSVPNDITATLNNGDFSFEANKHYKLVLNLGLTSAKFEVFVLDDSGEWILLSAVVKEWDLKTIEVDVE